MSIVLCIAVVLFFSCSFSAQNDFSADTPKIVFENAHIERYENAKEKFLVTAQRLESYPSKEIFAGENVYIVQFNDNKEAQLKASAGMALLLQKQKQYFLGDNVFVQTKKEKLTIAAANLFFDENENMLYGVEGETVRVQSDDNTVITGTNFSANTLSQKFQLAQAVSGSSELKNEEKDESEGSDEMPNKNEQSVPGGE